MDAVTSLEPSGVAQSLLTDSVFFSLVFKKSVKERQRDRERERPTERQRQEQGTDDRD